NYSWGTWVAEDSSSKIYIQGPDNTREAVAYFDNNPNNKLAGRLNVSRGINSGFMFAKDSGYYFHIKKTIKNGVRVADSMTLVDQINKGKEIVYYFESIEEEEIDLSYLIHVNFSLPDGTLFELYQFEKYPFTWRSSRGEEAIDICFGDNRTFTINSSNGSTTSGTYICDFEKAVLSLNNKDIFDSNEIVLTYSDIVGQGTYYH
ncbi:MAG: hypothetical protein HUJ59_05060, partial [Bacilli bacterium]|nr:hypothetical protein [Bacilli bacterium]